MLALSAESAGIDRLIAIKKSSMIGNNIMNGLEHASDGDACIFVTQNTKGLVI